MAIEFAPHNMTFDNEPTPYVASASSETGGTNYGAYKAFNNDIGHRLYWAATSVISWLKIYIGTTKYTLLNYTIQDNGEPTGGLTMNPKAWTLEGSIDNTNWNVLSTVTNQTGWTLGEKRVFTCDAIGGFYNYFKVNITENNGSATNTAIGELFLYGSAELPPTNFLKERKHHRIDLSKITGDAYS